jgi:putative serine/threonine protein kinase
VRRLKSGQVVSLKALRKIKHCRILGYPRCEQENLERRLKELEGLGVQALEFTGEKSIFDVPVLGKGCVGIVVVAYTSSGRAALKIRRVDADRKGMFYEGEMLKRANTINVGPKVLEISENFLLMELIEGNHFPEWIESLGERDAKSSVRLVLKDVLEQCYKLDKMGLDHGELSNAAKHILVNDNNRSFLVDFETASINRRVSNVTSVCHYFFLGSQIAYNVKRKLRKLNEKELIKALRIYKRKGVRKNYERLVEIILN